MKRNPLAEKLQALGLVHITGLPYANYWNHGQPAAVQADKNNLGKYGDEAGFIVIISPEGEVWIGSTESEIFKAATAKGVGGTVILQMCPNGSGAKVPDVLGPSMINSYFLLRRVGDPYSTDGGSPVPKVRE